MIMNPLEDKSQYVLFPDFGKVIEPYIPIGTWTAPVDCWIAGFVDTKFSINGVTVISVRYLNNSTTICIPIKKGDVIEHNDDYNNITAYGMRR